jgi:hypothetical protein
MKKEVIIYDYVDLDVPVPARKYKKRLAGYKALGCEIKEYFSAVDRLRSSRCGIFP